jgi:hypothetical protein
LMAALHGYLLGWVVKLGKTPAERTGRLCLFRTLALAI